MKLQIEDLGKVSITVEAEFWDKTRAYPKLTIVSVEDTYSTFISRKPVPSNTELTNRQYWIPFSNLKEEIVLNYNAFKAYVMEQLAEQRVYIDGKFAIERERIDELFAAKSAEIDLHIQQLDRIVEQQSARLDAQDRDIQAISDRVTTVEAKVDNISTQMILPLIEEILSTKPIVQDANYVHTDNNYSNGDKQKLQDLPTNTALTQLLNDIIAEFNNYYTKQQTYNKTEIDNKVKVVADALADLINGDNPTTAIVTFNEVKSFLADYQKTDTLKNLLDGLETALHNWADLKFVQSSHLYDNIYNKLEVDNKILQVNNKFSDYLTASVIASTYLTAANAQTLYQPKGTYLTPNDVDNVPTAGSNNPVKSGGVKTALDDINDKIPSAASSSNQLADKEFVNSSIATNTATYRGSYNVVTDLSESVLSTNAQIAAALGTTIATADNNDYCYVQIPVSDSTPTVISQVRRFKHNGTAWVFEFILNNSGYTQAQWDAINSAITSALVVKLTDLPSNTQLTNLLNLLLSKTEAATLYQPIGNYALVNNVYSKQQIDEALALKADKDTVDDLVEDVDTLTDDVKDLKKYLGPWEETVINNNDHVYVDLGLPSGTLWAKWNLGDAYIDGPDTGYHYAYGQLQNGCVDSVDIYTGTENPLAKGYDVANVDLGGDWHIPYDWQLRELLALPSEYVQQYEDIETGVTINKPGYIFTGPNGNHIFIPFVGRLDSIDQPEEYPSGDEQHASLLCATYDDEHYALTNQDCLISYMTEYDITPLMESSREIGYSIRPCLEPSTKLKTLPGGLLKDNAEIGDYKYYNGATLSETQRGRILLPNVCYELDLTQTEDSTTYGMTFFLPVVGDDGTIYYNSYRPSIDDELTRVNEWTFTFTAPTTGTVTLNLILGVYGSTIIWKNALTIVNGMTYEISIRYNKKRNVYYATAIYFASN